MSITIHELEVLVADQPPPPPVMQEYRQPKVTARDARHQVLGAMKLIARMSGMDMTRDVHPTELLVERIDQLEEEMQALRRSHEAELQKLRAAHDAEKDTYRNQIRELTRALRNVSIVLDNHYDPFELKPPSKWNKPDMGKWMMGVTESIKWAVQRIDNLLDPATAKPIAPDPEPEL